MTIKSLYGLATGIGSMPHTAAGPALELIFDALPEVPHWPQLPKRSPQEGFITQYVYPLMKLGLVVQTANGSLIFCTNDGEFERRSLSFYERVVAAQEGDRESRQYFAFPPGLAAGFDAFIDGKDKIPQQAVYVKGQISGPVTVGFRVTDQDGKPAFYNPQLREILVHALTGQAYWQAGALKSMGLPALIFIDDPYIYSYGSSGAVGLSREAVQESLQAMIDGIHAGGGWAGVHCCAGIDWSLLLELPLDVVSFDAYSYFPSMLVYSESLQRYLETGSLLAWGMVPTSEQVLQEDAASLQEKLVERRRALSARGVSEERLQEQYMITPSCGTGTLNESLAEKIYRLTAELKKLMKE